MNDTTTSASASAAEPSAGSLDAIAATLVAEPDKPRRPARAQPEPQDAPPAPAPGEADDADQDLDPDGGEDEDDDDFMDGLSAKAGDDDAPDAAEFDPEDDDAFVHVKHNGKVEQVSLADLKKSWSGTKGIDARVQEAAEERNAAKAERETVSQIAAQTQTLHDRLAAVYQHYNGALFVPKVQRPHPDMQNHDPIGYFSQMEAWRSDQERLGQEQQAMQQTLQEASQTFQRQRHDRLTQEVKALHTKLPGLSDPANAAAFKKRLASIGEAHGFTKDEIASADDHRILTLAAEAAAYRELKAKLAGKRVPKTAETAEVKRRPMPTRGDNRQKGETHKAASKARRLLARARETGSVDDISLTLLL